MECVKGRPQPFGVEIRKDHINFAVQVPTGKKCELLLYKKGSMYRIFIDNLLYHGCVPLDEDGALWMEDVPSYTYPYLTGEILQLEEKVSGRQVVSCYDTRTGELLYRRTLGLGDDQQEPLEDW